MRPVRLLSALALAALCAVAFWRCGSARCLVAGTNRLDQLALQLEGGCCGFRTQPTNEQPDNSCKAIGGSLTYSLFYGEHDCVAWAADCLAAMGEQARPAVPALIYALREGPNNFDTGDGVIHTRDRIALALGATGDPRALEPLLEALASPRPYDAGLGAAGYTSPKPRGQPALIEALGSLGPTAKPAVDAVLGHFTAPVEEAYDELIARSAAEALGAIGDPRVIPVLIAALDDPDRAIPAARALGVFGPTAQEAAPALTRLVQADPDGAFNEPFRYAIFSIAGRAAFEALPNNYSGMTTKLMRLLKGAAKDNGIRLAGVHVDGPNQQIVQKLASGEAIGVTFDRDVWAARRVVAGTLWLERGGGAISESEHVTLGELERNLERLFADIAVR